MTLRAREFGSSSGISSRSMFACSDEPAKFLSASGRTPMQMPTSPRSFFSSSSGGRSTVDLSSSMRVKDEDDVLLALSASARATVENARHAVGSTGWKERKDGQGVRIFERRSTPGVFDVAATTGLPCSATEILEVLSSRNSDDFNATMVALLGDAFSYAVTLREVPTASTNTHLSTKRMQFSGAIPLLSSTKTVEFLDFVEFDYKTRTAVRTFQTLTRDRAGRLIVGGDVLAGYVLAEDVKTHQTSVFYFGTHKMSAGETKSRGIVKAKLKVATVREASAHALLKLAKLIPKIGDIALRRRLGAVDPAESVGDGSCSGCGRLVKESLLRKKHVCYICGHDSCGSCSKSQDVEGLIGVIERLRVCCMCISSARHRAFDSVDPSLDDTRYLLRPSMLSTLSTTSTSRTTSTTPSSVRTRIVPARAY